MADLDSTSWSEIDASNTAAPPAGWPPGMFPNQVEPTAQAMMGALKRWWNRSNGVYASTGGAGVYAVTPSNPIYPIAYVDGERYCFKAHQISVGGDTLNWNALGAKPIYKPAAGGIVAIGAGDIVAGQRVDATYDSTLNGGAGGFAVMGPALASLGAPTGTVADFAGATAPSGWLLCFGQAVSRTSFATLFSVIGTTYGGGDGSTTFNLPDCRGRATFGKDDMGGTAASRVTAAQSGIGGTTLGAAGGDERLHAHGHGVSDPGHGHGVNDPSHRHTSNNGNGFITGGSGGVQIGGPVNGEAQDANVTAFAGTGISIQGSGTGIGIQVAGAGGSQNMPPAIMLNKIIKT
jgi:microcystin-dependent protein